MSEALFAEDAASPHVTWNVSGVITETTPLVILKNNGLEARLDKQSFKNVVEWPATSGRQAELLARFKKNKELRVKLAAGTLTAIATGGALLGLGWREGEAGRVFRLAGRGLWLWQVTGLQSLSRKLGLTRLLPGPIRDAEPMTPTIQAKFSDQLIPPVSPALSERRYRVALLTGCMQDLIFSDVNQATAEVLAENGCEVVTPREQHCCGSLHAHNGDIESAQLLARRQIDAIDPSSVDAIISNAGGCGFHLRHYDRLLADDTAYAARAVEWSAKLRDIHEWLVEIGFRKPETPDSPTVPVTYHESCHLCHGLKVSQQPRAILRAIPGVELLECKDATTCCGSAGIYNLTQPDTANRLREDKVTHLRATGATVVATANPGCHLHIANGFDGSKPRIAHPVLLLAEAYRRERGTKPH